MRLARFVQLSVLPIAIILVSFSISLAAEIRVDLGDSIGAIRPLHGVNSGPLCCGETIDLSPYWKQLSIPNTRLHDCEWPAPDLVDMAAVFPNLKADAGAPESYHFGRTDDYLKAIDALGVGIVYRLGESIEHSKRKHRVNPPADYDQWAAACIGIIRHYNEGWADGFQMKIRYWEIWNEPENRPAMWTGSEADYFRLYSTAAKAIKARFPEVKVGGPAVGASGEMVNGEYRPIPFMDDFLKHCRETGAPLDFFSWHTYTDDPSLYVQKAKGIRAWLDKNGFDKTESHLNEWNYLPNNDWGPMLAQDNLDKRAAWYAEQGGCGGAAFLTSTLVGLQDAPLDVGNYYTGDASAFGLFNFYGVPNKTFFGMKAFAMLCDHPLRVRTTLGQSGSAPGEMAAAAGLTRDRTEAVLLVSNYRGKEGRFSLIFDRLPWQGPTEWEILRLDTRNDLKGTESGTAAAGDVRLNLELPSPAVAVVRLREKAAR